MKFRIASAIAAIAAFTLANLPFAAKAAGYPERPIQIVVPFPPGGSVDVLGRHLARQLESYFDKPVIVENKPGGGTVLGAQAVARARPDGYVLLLSSNSTFTLGPILQEKVPYDTATDFEPVLGILANIPLVLVASTASSVPKDIPALINEAKADPQKYSYGSFGNGTVSHFAGEMFNGTAGIKLLHVPYRGSALMMNDLISGRVPLAIDTVVSAFPQIKSGKLHPMAVTTTQRSALLQETPTMAEAGYPTFTVGAWVALVGPRNMPAAAKQRLESALITIMKDEGLREKLKAAGFEPSVTPIADWASFIRKDISVFKAVADRARITAD